MSLHHITWRATAGAVEDETLIADAIAWLVGDPELVDIEQTTSYHGSPIHLVTGVCKKKQQSLKSLARIGTDNLIKLRSELEQRFDQNNTLHFR
ncbi:MAG: RNA-binding domain-containing protein, partial [Candidatus Poseidoniaceae archaeon]|nr:RNA-binding domain-containing protein [Candidatus Poseidoniaceae archaeon]